MENTAQGVFLKFQRKNLRQSTAQTSLAYVHTWDGCFLGLAASCFIKMS